MTDSTYFKQLIILFLPFLFSSWIGFGEAWGQGLPSSISLFRGQEMVFQVEGIKRVLAVNPGILVVTKTPGQLKIRGRQIGQTSLVIWTSSGRLQVRVETKIPPRPKSLQEDRLKTNKYGIEGARITLDYQYNWGQKGPSLSDLSPTEDYHHLGMGISFPFWKKTNLSLSSSMSKRSGGKNDIEFGNVTWSNLSWPKGQRYAIKVGNIPAESRGSLTYTPPLEGIRVHPLRIPVPYDRKNPSTVTLSYGKRYVPQGSTFGGGYFNLSQLGSTSSLFSTTKEEKLFALGWKYEQKKMWRPFPFFRRFGIRHGWKCNYTKYFKTKDQEAEEVLDVNLDLDWDLNLDWRGKKKTRGFELSLSVGGLLDTGSYGVAYKKKWKHWALDVGRKVQVQTQFREDVISQSQRDYFSLKYHRKTLGSLWTVFRSSWETSRMTRQSNLLESFKDDDLVWNHRFGVSARFIKKYFLSFRTSYVDGEESVNPYNRLDWTGAISAVLPLKIPITWRATYSEGETERLIDEEKSSERKKYSLSAQVPLTTSVRYGVSFNRAEEYLKSGEDNNTETYRHTLSYQRRMLKNKGSFHGQYSYEDVKTRENGSDSYSGSRAGKSHYLSASVSYAFNGAHSMGISSSLGHSKRPNNESNPEEWRARLSIKWKSRFHTLFGWRPKTEIGVIAFYDRNGNGAYDEAVDLPYSGGKIQLNGKEVGETLEDGHLFLGKIKGFTKTVSIDRNSVPRGYIYSTSTEYTFTNKRFAKETCYFGLVLNTEFNGTVYNDVDGDGRFSSADEPLRGVIVKTSNGIARETDRSGYFTFRGMEEGVYSVEVDPFSLPKGFKSLHGMKSDVQLEKGQISKVNFAFKANRLIKGRVRLQTKGGKTKNIAKVHLEIDGQEKKTSKKGKFKFRNLPAGRYYLKLDLKSIPYKVEIISPAPVKGTELGPSVWFPIEMASGPDQITNFQIILKKRDS